MPIYYRGGQILFAGSRIAFSQNCCDCVECPNCEDGFGPPCYDVELTISGVEVEVVGIAEHQFDSCCWSARIDTFEVISVYYGTVPGHGTRWWASYNQDSPCDQNSFNLLTENYNCGDTDSFSGSFSCENGGVLTLSTISCVGVFTFTPNWSCA